MSEQGSLSTVSVLDRRDATLHSRPRKGIIVAVSTAVAALLAAAWVVYRVRREVPEAGDRAVDRLAFRVTSAVTRQGRCSSASPCSRGSPSEPGLGW